MSERSRMRQATARWPRLPGGFRSGYRAAAVLATLTLAACSQGAPEPDHAPRVDHAESPPAQTPETRADEPTGAPTDGRAGERPAPRRFSFAAAGDHGANRLTAQGLRWLDRSNARFYIALGDLDYDETSTDRAWCRYVKDRLHRKGRRFPFEVLAGNHEEDGGPDGRIRHHRRCLPDRMDSHGRYGEQYSFSYPRRHPFAKLVLVSPGLTVDGHTYTYEKGTADRHWLNRQVTRAHRAGIRWVVVGMHKPCLSMGAGHPGCDSGPAILNLLLRRKVDLVIGGHNHVYERSKQLARSDACPRLGPGEYDADCVVGSGAGGQYIRGRGTVIVNSGRFGGEHQGLAADDPEAPYFRKAGGGTTGFVRYTVTPTRLEGRYVRTSGRMRDSFVIR